MAFLKNVILACSPRRLVAAMERESRQWIMRCPEGHEQSVWDAGGIRFGAKGNPRKMVWCPKCEQLRWQRLYKRGSRAVIDGHETMPN